MREGGKGRYEIWIFAMVPHSFGRVTIIGACAAIMGALAYSLFAFDWAEALGVCDVEVRSTTLAPDGKLKAVVFGTECGATTPYNTQVSLAPAHTSFSRTNNPAFFVLLGKHDVNIRWNGSRSLEIVVATGGEVVKKQEAVGSISIEYGKPSPGTTL